MIFRIYDELSTEIVKNYFKNSLVSKLIENVNENQEIPFTMKIGYLAISFVAGLIYLKKEKLDFFDVLKDVVSKG